MVLEPLAPVPNIVPRESTICAVAVDGLVVQGSVTVMGTSAISTVEQFINFDWVPEVMVTEAFLVPAVEYPDALEIGLVVPDKPSSPLQLYVYVPVPPDGSAVQVTPCPTLAGLGLAEQDPLSGKTVKLFSV